MIPKGSLLSQRLAGILRRVWISTYSVSARIALGSARMPPAARGFRKGLCRGSVSALSGSSEVRGENQVRIVCAHLNDPENLMMFFSSARELLRVVWISDASLEGPSLLWRSRHEGVQRGSLGDAS